MTRRDGSHSLVVRCGCTYRELIVGNYRVVYRVDEDTVTIVTLIHGARILRL